MTAGAEGWPRGYCQEEEGCRRPGESERTVDGWAARPCLPGVSDGRMFERYRRAEARKMRPGVRHTADADRESTTEKVCLSPDLVVADKAPRTSSATLRVGHGICH